MKKPFLLCLILLTLYSCKSKKRPASDEESKNYFPIASFLKSQVAHVDTSLFRIMKIVTVDSISDTSFLKREEFADAAKEFLNIPDITSSEYRDEYTETKLYDDVLQKVVLNYEPSDKEAEVPKQEVIIEPDPQNGDKVRTIIINKITDENGIVQKNLLWEVNSHFQVITKTQKGSDPQKIEKLKVIWSGF